MKRSSLLAQIRSLLIGLGTPGVCLAIPLVRIMQPSGRLDFRGVFLAERRRAQNRCHANWASPVLPWKHNKGHLPQDQRTCIQSLSIKESLFRYEFGIENLSQGLDALT